MSRTFAILMFVFLIAVLVFAPVCAGAEAAIPDTVVEAVTEPLTWEYLATVGGCALFVLVVVQLTKGMLDKLIKIPTAVYSYVLAVLTMILATAFTAGLTLSGALLTLFNGWIVASTASRTYDALARKE